MKDLITPREVTFGRNKMPYTLRIMLKFLTFAGLYSMAMFGEKIPPFWYFMLYSIAGIFLGLAVYGFLSILAAWKRERTLNGVAKDIKKTYQDAVK
jgi:hypothetical protein